MGVEILVPLGFFAMVTTIAVGMPLARAAARRMERQSQQITPDVAARLDRIEQAVETVAVEVERISEGQRFVTKLLSERTPPGALPQPAESPTARS